MVTTNKGNKLKKMITGLLLALAMIVAVPAPAQAGNGAADFYLSGKCYVDGGPARLSVTNWDTSSTVQRYHMDLYAGPTRSASGGIILPTYENYAIYFDGVRQTGTNDIYKNVSGHGRHNIKGMFLNKLTGSIWSCTLTL